VPPALDALILQCLEKNPDRRPKDAQAVLRLVRECRVGAIWNNDRARQWWEAHLPDLSITQR
jgi:serine/threonine-protein kinase